MHVLTHMVLRSLTGKAGKTGKDEGSGEVYGCGLLSGFCGPFLRRAAFNVLCALVCRFHAAASWHS